MRKRDEDLREVIDYLINHRDQILSLEDVQKFRTECVTEMAKKQKPPVREQTINANLKQAARPPFTRDDLDSFLLNQVKKEG